MTSVSDVHRLVNHALEGAPNRDRNALRLVLSPQAFSELMRDPSVRMVNSRPPAQQVAQIFGINLSQHQQSAPALLFFTERHADDYKAGRIRERDLLNGRLRP
jgi:hypothetical protein